MNVKAIFLAAIAANLVAVPVSAQTALRLDTDGFFLQNSAAISKSGLKYLEEYFESQECEKFEIYGYNPAGFKDHLVESRARVVNAMAKRYDANTKLVIKQDRSNSPEAATYDNGEYDRRVEIVPKNCFAPAALAAGSAGGAAALVPAAGLGAVVVLGTVAGGTSTSNTN